LSTDAELLAVVSLSRSERRVLGLRANQVGKDLALALDLALQATAYSMWVAVASLDLALLAVDLPLQVWTSHFAPAA
jgi:hypothetical protein